MIEINIPGRKLYQISSLVLDVNGTIALDGTIIDHVPERLIKLSKSVEITLVTADTQGTAVKLADYLNLKLINIQTGNEDKQKLAIIRETGSEATIAIGNGANDSLMLEEAAIGICVAGKEGAAGEAIRHCDVWVNDINTALDLLLKPKRLIATLRK